MVGIANVQWVVERLNQRHDRSRFSSGQAALDDWLKQRAGQFDRKDLARTYVAVHHGDVVVQGYYALLTHHVRHQTLSSQQARGLPRIDVPVLLLGRLAVDRQTQRHGLGAHLLIDALRRAERIAEQVGIRAVEVDAIDDAARNFYLKYGFTPLLDDPRHLFLPMQTIRKLNLPPS